MTDYKTLYYLLFAAAADAVASLEQWNPGQARDILIRAQQRAEEAILSESEAGETD